MAPYLFSFAASLSIIAVIQKWNRKGVGFVSWSVVSLLIPCCLAGMRSPMIGTDVQVYVQPLFDLANGSVSFADYQASQWWGVWRYIHPSDYEIGFSFLVWIVSSVTHSLPALLFVIQAATIVPIYLGLLKVRHDIPLWLGMAVYYFMYFNSTLNLMRQWIAIAILLFALHYLFEGRRLTYAGFVAMATLFHASALLGFGILALSVYLSNGNDPIKRTVIVGLVAILTFFAIPIASNLLIAIGFGRYAGYLGDVHVLPMQIVLRLPLLALLIYYWKNGGESRLVSLFIGMLCFDVVLSQLASANVQSGRIGYYFASVAILYVPIVLANAKSGVGKLGLAAFLIVYCAAYWLYTYAISGAAETIPYLVNSAIGF